MQATTAVWMVQSLSATDFKSSKFGSPMFGSSFDRSHYKYVCLLSTNNKINHIRLFFVILHKYEIMLSTQILLQKVAYVFHRFVSTFQILDPVVLEIIY